MRLWARLALTLATVAVVSVAVVGGIASTMAARQAERDSWEGLRREARLHAEVVGRWVADQQAQAEAWSQVFPGRVSDMDDPTRQGFLAAVYRGTPPAVSVVLVDQDGQPVVPAVYRRTPGERPAADPARIDALVQRLPLTEAMASGSAVGAPWRPDPAEQVPSVPLAVLVATGPADGDALVLGLELQLNGAGDLPERIEEGHAVALLGADGRPLVGEGHPLLDVELLAPLLRQDADFRYGEGTSQALGSIVPVPFTPWSAVVVEPAWQVRATARSIRLSVVTAAGVAALLATALALIVATSLSQPVIRLRDAALALAEGHPRGPAALDRSDEIGELGRAFDHMAEQLDAQRREIEGFNEELQQRVDERTRDLEQAQAELVRSEQLAAVAEVGAGLAHELNNPLASVLGIAQVLRMQRPDDELVADLEGEAARCREVVQAMLRFAAGEVDPDDAPVIDLRDVLREVTGLVSGAFRQRGVALELAIASTRPLSVRMDPVVATRMLAQVLKALRAGLEPGAVLTVRSVDDDPGQVMLRFEADQGLGGSESRRDDLRASGMELWVARQQVDRSGGRLEAVVGGGTAGPDAVPTCWTLWLPRAEGV